jgi:bacterioferritin-associated ferredoxin
MYVCICNALTDRAVRRVAAETGCTRPRELYAACGCQAQCGRCVKAVLTVARAAAMEMAAD